MNSLHGIKISNDAAAVRGKSLTYDRRSHALKLDGKPLTSTHLNRKSATAWAAKHGATVAAV